VPATCPYPESARSNPYTHSNEKMEVKVFSNTVTELFYSKDLTKSSVRLQVSITERARVYI